MYKHLYSRFLESNSGVLHFAAHSHYYWPDVTRDAQLQYWDDSAKYVDSKWDFLFRETIPTAQNYIASRLHTAQPEQIVLAPNTHELVVRLLSCFAGCRPIRILTTDSEFHSFDRQVKRMEEVGDAKVEWVATQPFDTFEERFLESMRSAEYDLIFISSIFFNSGLGIEKIATLASAAQENPATLVVDGYHSFCALPIDLMPLRESLFFLGGGYKYAQSGEGICFMHVPTESSLTPTNTGWFAEFGDLADRQSDQVGFARNGQRFAGATFDPSGVYRFNAVMKMLDENQLDQVTIHEYIQKLQSRFLAGIEQIQHPLINLSSLLDCPGMSRGHFFAFDLASTSTANELAAQLKAEQVVCDVRKSRIRFGFGMYQDEDDVDELVQRIGRI